MSIERFHTNDRMSQMVIHGDTVYLAGQVALGAPGESVADQTRAILGQIDALLAEAGTDKSKALTATIWLCSCLLYTSPSPRDKRQSRMPSSA